MDSEILQITTTASGVCRVTLNDQKRRNALSTSMLSDLTGVIQTASGDHAVRVIVIAAKGPAFSAGHDLKEIRAARDTDDKGRDAFTHMLTACASLMQSIVNAPKPVIAEIAGVATAAGCQLVASCDLAIAGEDARFATPGVNIGLFCSTPMVALSRNINNKQALEMLLTGDMIDARKAVDIGLVNRAVPNDQLTQCTMDLAEKIAAKSSKVLAIGKSAFYKQREMDLASAYEYTSKVMAENMLNAQAEKGINAFLDKEKMDWSDD
ncbi:MAG: enoyl-CoA hydratase [Acidimicrobiales bacterium]|nr:enoyl-CoA hydratase [Hyphomonadaceae bacterium]RZV43044.1 MAG: enoyl-CoA hydratase [Acidimicrobiales bacterium]